MRRVTLRSLWAHKRRLVSTILSIVLGVAFLSGTYVFTDTLDKVFDDLFSQVSEGVDARVQGEVLFNSGQGDGDQRGRFDQAVLEVVRGVEGVGAAEPYTETIGFGPVNRILDAEGEPVGATNGPPTLLQSWVDNEEVSPYELTEGSRAPAADGEIALNVAAAEDGGFEIGDRVTVSNQFGNAEYTLVGTFTFGDAESAAGAVSATFTLAEAQRLAGAEGELNSILVAAQDGISEAEITTRIAAALPGGVEAVTGTEAAEQDASSVQDGFGFFRTALTIFGAIALLVAIFIIANTFQILVAQRSRELALLRAVGASRAQVLRSVLLEALVVGTVAAAVGLAAGIALAIGVRALLEGIGADLPSGDLVISSTTVVVAFVVGIAVTVVAALAPAIRATRVPPLAALRDVAVERTRPSRTRIFIGVAVLAFAAFNLSKAFGADDTDVVPTVGTGALLLVVGAIVVGPVLAGPTVRLLGAAVPKLRGVTGKLAVENAVRSPKRTSATASALLIGVALIGFITVFAASAKKSVEAEVNRGFSGDIIVQPAGSFFGGFGGFSPEVTRAVAEVEGIELATSFAGDEMEVRYADGDTATTFVGAIDPEVYDRIAEAKMTEGSLGDLRPGTVLVDRQIAEDNALEIGSPVTMTFPSGRRLEVSVGGISDDLVVLAPWTITLADYEQVTDERLDFQVLAAVEDGRDVDEVLARVEQVIDPYPGLEALDRDDWAGDLADQLTAFVNVIYALLALSIVIALIGVANTLSLSVHERTRELGLLRAVGMARSQVRSAIRWEAVLIAVLGTVVGLGVGLVASYCLMQALKSFGLRHFALPVGSLIGWTIAFALFGVLASLRTAHRASKLDILRAIATE